MSLPNKDVNRKKPLVEVIEKVDGKEQKYSKKQMRGQNPEAGTLLVLGNWR